MQRSNGNSKPRIRRTPSSLICTLRTRYLLVRQTLVVPLCTQQLTIPEQDLEAYSRITGKDITGPVPVVSIPQKLNVPSTAEGEVEPSENLQEGSEDIGAEDHMDQDEASSV